jgi:WD40 repeat protein
VTVTEDAERMSLVDPEALPEGILEPVAVFGSRSCDPDSAGGGCVVLFNSQDGEEQGAWSATAKGIVSPFPDLLSIGGIAPDGTLSGVASVSEDLSACSVVLGRDWARQEWSTCDYSLGKFSPDGRYVIGHPAQQSGIGDASVAILDARTGDLLAEFQNSEEHQSFINDVVWDSDSTLLATVFEDGWWQLMRMTPQGELSSVLPNLGEDPDDVPLQLATQP